MHSAATRMHRIGISSLALAIALASGGCAFFQSSSTSSDSSGSSSDSSGSSSDSSGSSSGGDDHGYREDVQAFTLAHVEAAGSPETLRLGLSEVALARGISDWEALPATFSAIGLYTTSCRPPIFSAAAKMSS